jgi:hypothetical protein
LRPSARGGISVGVSQAEKPAPDRETPDPLRTGLSVDLNDALNERHGPGLDAGEHIRLEARLGPRAAWILARVGTDQRAFEMELFAREVSGEELEGALGVLVDWLDGALGEWLAAGREGWVGLDWDRRELDGVSLWVRGELRDYEAEALADRLLAGDE